MERLAQRLLLVDPERVRASARGQEYSAAGLPPPNASARAEPGVCGLRLYVERDNSRAQRPTGSGLVDSGYFVMEDDFSAVAQVGS